MIGAVLGEIFSRWQREKEEDVYVKMARIMQGKVDEQRAKQNAAKVMGIK